MKAGTLKGKDEEILNHYKNQQSLRGLARMYQVTPKAISDLIKRNNIPILGITDNVNGREADIIRDYSSGMRERELFEKYNIGHVPFNRVLREGGIKKRIPGEGRRRRKVDESFFDVIDSEQKAYFLGFLYADGYNHEKSGAIRLALDHKDREILEKLSIVIGSDAPLYSDRTLCRLAFSSKRMSKRLVELGCHQAKSKTLTFPHFLADEMIHHFIRGYFDGDGHIVDFKKYPQTGRIEILGSHSFIESLSEVLLLKCGAKSHFQPDRRAKSVSVLRVNCVSQAGKVAEYLFRNATIFLTRKRSRIDYLINLYQNHTGKGWLSKDRVLQIKERLQAGESGVKISKDLGIGRNTVSRVKLGRVYC
jgi:hypothetical protein